MVVLIYTIVDKSTERSSVDKTHGVWVRVGGVRKRQQQGLKCDTEVSTFFRRKRILIFDI